MSESPRGVGALAAKESILVRPGYKMMGHVFVNHQRQFLRPAERPHSSVSGTRDRAGISLPYCVGVKTDGWWPCLTYGSQGMLHPQVIIPAGLGRGSKYSLLYVDSTWAR